MDETVPTARPLDNIKVLDLSRVLAGPLCSSMLGDLGATVTKIEIPDRGDDSRQFGPHIQGESSYFMLVNRGKKSVTIDMKSPEGHELLLGLIKRSDVVVENFRPGVTKRLGIDYDTVKGLNPGLVYVSISGFGQAGPLAHRPAYDHVVQALGGIMNVTGWPGGSPTRVGDAIGDVVAGIYGSWGALAALLQRTRTGEGQHVDVAMLDAVMSLQMVSLSQIVGGNTKLGRIGNAHPVSAPMDSYKAKNGYIVIAVANDSLFVRLADAMGQCELPADPRFATDSDRLHHQEDLRSVIETWTASLTVDEIGAILDIAGVPAAPIRDLAQAIDSPHSRHRGLLHTVQHPVAGAVRVMPQPVHFSGMAGGLSYVAPSLGEHTDDVLTSELGLSVADVEGFRSRGVI